MEKTYANTSNKIQVFYDWRVNHHYLKPGETFIDDLPEKSITEELRIINELADIPVSLVPMIRKDFGGAGREFAVAAALGSKIYVGTGTDLDNKKDWWEYDPATDLWTQKTDFGGTGRCGAVAVALGSKIYVGTGMDPDNKKDWWEYDPATDLWTQKTDFGGAARFGVVAASIGSKTYVGTGYTGVRMKDWFLQVWNY